MKDNYIYLGIGLICSIFIPFYWEYIIPSSLLITLSFFQTLELYKKKKAHFELFINDEFIKYYSILSEVKKENERLKLEIEGIRNRINVGQIR